MVIGKHQNDYLKELSIYKCIISLFTYFYSANHNLVLRQLIARDKEALNMKKNYSHIVHKHQQLRKDYQKLIGNKYGYESIVRVTRLLRL